MPKGGARTGSGRSKRKGEPLKKTGVALLESDIESLKYLGKGSVSAGIRRAIEICFENGALKSKEEPFLVSNELFEFFKPFLPDGEKGDLHWKVSSVLAYIVFSEVGLKIKYWPKGRVMSYQAVKRLSSRIGSPEKLCDLYSALRPRTSEFTYFEVEDLREKFSDDAKLIDDYLTKEWRDARKRDEIEK